MFLDTVYSKFSGKDVCEDTDVLSFFDCALSYYRLGENAEEKDAEEIIDLASKASVADQQKQVQENVHYQLSHMFQAMDDVLRPDVKDDPSKDPSKAHSHPQRSGLSFAVGRAASANMRR